MIIETESQDINTGSYNTITIVESGIKLNIRINENKVIDIIANGRLNIIPGSTNYIKLKIEDH